MMTISLKTPVSFKGEEFSKITLREPRARDIAAADHVDGKTKKSFAVYASMADVPLAVVMDLTLHDLQQLTAAAEALLGNVPASVGEE